MYWNSPTHRLEHTHTLSFLDGGSHALLHLGEPGRRDEIAQAYRKSSILCFKYDRPRGVETGRTRCIGALVIIGGTRAACA